jgi:cell division protease FtsH
VSIIPRGRALGVTMFLPEEDRYSMNRRHLISQICALYGGRIAEELTLGKEGVTTGASNDIQRATEIARNMVTKWGFSESLGPLMYEDAQQEVFLGKSSGGGAQVSGSTRNTIDEEVRAIVDNCYENARNILIENRSKLDAMAEALMKYETIDAHQIDDIMEGKPPRTPKGWTGKDDGPSSPSESQKEEPLASEEKPSSGDKVEEV